MTHRLSVWLGLSLVIHAGLVGAGSYLLIGATPPILFIDLVHGLFDAADGASPGWSGRGNGMLAAGPREAVPAGRGAASPAKPSPPSGPSAARDEPARSAPQAAELPRPTPGPVLTPEPAPALPEATRSSPEPTRPPSEPISAPPAPAVPPPARGSGSGPPSVVVGVPSDATSHGGEMLASAGAGGTDTSAAGAHGTGSGSAAPGRGAAGDGGAGLGFGARGGSALALAVPGDGGGDGAADAIYHELRQRLQAALVYPPRARPRRLTGVVEVELEIQPSGAITRVVVAVSSSHPLLDAAAVDTVRGLGQVPFPPSIRPRVLRVRLPVEFAFR